MNAPRGFWAVIVGCGGNIGSHVGPLVARIPGVQRITLVDFDTYEAKNLSSQAITRSNVGKAKAAVQARRLRGISTKLSVRGVKARVEDVPLGQLRGDVLLACLDSRLARRAVNTIAWRLGIPWIDAGVAADGLLARVNVYRPEAEQPCLECGWDDADYAALEVAYPCAGDATPAPTNAPAALGALAASLQAIECQKVLAGEWGHALVARQVTIAADTHRHYVTAFRRNPRCRFDHATWTIEALERGPDEITVADAFALGRGAGADTPVRVRVAGQTFARRLTCPACGTTRELPLALTSRLGSTQRTCACHTTMQAAGVDATEWLRPDGLSAAERAVTLARLGIASGDVLVVETGERTTHHQIGGRR